jgi:hypothetical protein
MSQSNGSSVDALFKTATQDGLLSKAALNVIQISDIGDEINNALGVSVDDVKASEVVLVTQLIDDSSSIRFITGNTEAVRDGHNLILDTLHPDKTKKGDGILASCSYLNLGLLYPYTSVDKALRMTASNYDPSGGTPLFAQSVVTLSTVLAKYLEFSDNGINCRTVTPIVTDGGDNGGMRGADRVKKIVDDMLKQECHIIAGVGIFDGQLDGNKDPIPGTGTDFWEVFSGYSFDEIEKAKQNGSFASLAAQGGMGIRPQWVLTPKNSPSEIRRAFQMLSQSATRASQSAATFSQAAMGGFANP